MVFGLPEKENNFSLYSKRREELLHGLKEQFPSIKSGLIVIFGGFEQEHFLFRQDSSFYYLTGVTEPGVVLTIDLIGKTTLHIPCYKKNRSDWSGSTFGVISEDAQKIGVDEIKELGEPIAGYQSCSYISRQEYKQLLDCFLKEQNKKGTIFTLCPKVSTDYCWQRLLLERINLFIPNFNQMLVDISPILTSMRRRKDSHEIEMLYKAVEITILAQEAVAQSIEPDINESEVQASLEYIIKGAGARCAFPSIVASGECGTILHYNRNNRKMKEDELVVVDIGADYNYYCADITRTYPVSGFFTKRQRELYNIVLELQEYIASIAKPGYWINNEKQPEKSLNHLAKEFLQERGYDEYMYHGIGHFLGLDTHDVGDYTKPLQENDIITIEPGIYIKEEQLGIRIEDDYWITKDGIICLSENLPKKPYDIEAIVQQKLSDNSTASSIYPGEGFSEEETDA